MNRGREYSTEDTPAEARRDRYNRENVLAVDLFYIMFYSAVCQNAHIAIIQAKIFLHLHDTTVESLVTILISWFNIFVVRNAMRFWAPIMPKKLVGPMGIGCNFLIKQTHLTADSVIPFE